MALALSNLFLAIKGRHMLISVTFMPRVEFEPKRYFCTIDKMCSSATPFAKYLVRYFALTHQGQPGGLNPEQAKEAAYQEARSRNLIKITGGHATLTKEGKREFDIALLM